MSQDDNANFSVWGFIKGFGKLLIGILLLVQGLVGLAMLLFFVGIALSISNGVGGAKGDGGVVAKIEDGSALLLNPKGELVEETQAQDPFEEIFEEAYGIDDDTQVAARDVIKAIRGAKDDKRIKGIVLDLAELAISGSSASKIYEINAALDDFKAGGKKVYAVGDYYTQEGYLIAAHADEVMLHDYGNVVIYGYGSYNVFLKSFLEKLKVTTHVFRVGTFKSAVEPFIRDDMSPEAKEANLAFLNVLWDSYASSAEEARGLPQGAINTYANELPRILQEAKGDFAVAAKNYGLVDEIVGRPEQRARLVAEFGEDDDEDSYKHVEFKRYLSGLPKEEDDGDPNVAIVTASGVIVDGEAEPGEAAGGDTIAGYLKDVLDDDDVKAVVLRVDSPGGSAFASEVIRDGVLALKDAGKPVVVSMGSLAASGGYWISASADEIYAAPTTITGSIGIFGLFTTFENTAAEIGVHTDGVGTTALAPILNTGLGPLPANAADIFQRSVENGYDKFLAIVSEGRNLDRSYVDQVGQGRVWIGKKALELKLVDKLGGIDDATAAAAKRANLEKYDVVHVIEELTPFQRLFGDASAHMMKALGFDRKTALATHGAVRKFIAEAEATAKFFDGFNDPNGLYARCMACDL